METRAINVLVVDDETDFRQLMSFWLKSKNYSVSTAGDGKTAIQMLKDGQFDIVFLDLNMPEMDGVATLKNIREFNKEIPVIIISAYVDRLKVSEIKPYQISGVFYKGEDFDKGLSLLESTLRTHKKLKK